MVRREATEYFTRPGHTDPWGHTHTPRIDTILTGEPQDEDMVGVKIPFSYPHI